MTVNEDFRDQAISHAHYLERLKTGEVRKIIALVNEVDKELAEKLAARGAEDETFTKARLEALLKDVRVINAEAAAVLEKGLRGSMQDLATYESDFQARRLAKTVPIVWNISQPSPDQIMTAALNRPFENALFADHIRDILKGRRKRVEGALRMGQVEGQTIPQIVRRIKGTKAANYKDGLLEGSRREIESLVRTSLNHASTVSRERTYKANSDLVKEVQWVSTLDTATTIICADLDGKTFPIDSGQRPPAHWGCRSTTVPVVKSWRELGIDLDELPPGTRASMDGQVSEKETYAAWLKKQDAGRQREVLGAKRYEMYKAGTPIDRFVRDGRVLTIDELQRRETDAV